MISLPNPFKKSDGKERELSQTEAAFLALMSSIPGQSWFCTYRHSLVAGINLPTGTVSLTYPLSSAILLEKTGASSLPLPPSSFDPDQGDFVDRLVRFATR